MYPVEFFSSRASKNAAIVLFLIGLFSQLQVNVGGKLGISELIMVIMAPFVFLKNLHVFRQDGSLYFLNLIILWFIGALFVDIYTHNNLRLTLRGIAVPIATFSNVTCLYIVLRKDMRNLKWFLLGSAISGTLCIFVFQNGGAGEVAQAQGIEAGIHAVMDYKLFWFDQIRTWLTLPIIGWYLIVPKFYTICAMSFVSVFGLIVGGRSSFIVAALSVVFFLIAGKTRLSMMFIKKHLLTIVICIGITGLVGKGVYKYAATHGFMGEEEQSKYEAQTKKGSGIMSLLVSGRGSTFIGLSAIMDKPFIGHGSVPIDNHGYALEFISKYGDESDVRQIKRSYDRFGAKIIPSHSHIVTYWLWHGVLGLLFWVCVLHLQSRRC